MHELIPEILRRFEMNMAHDRLWKTKSAGFVVQSDVVVKLGARG